MFDFLIVAVGSWKRELCVCMHCSLGWMSSFNLFHLEERKRNERNVDVLFLTAFIQIVVIKTIDEAL